MEANANPADILLAYNEDFAGYTTINGLAQYFERKENSSPPMTGVLGGTEDPDGYYSDFTSQLGQFVRAYPRIGGGNASSRRMLDWGAIIITIDDPSDSEASDSEANEANEASDASEANEANTHGGDAPAVMSLGDFIVETDGGKAAKAVEAAEEEQDVKGGLVATTAAAAEEEQDVKGGLVAATAAAEESDGEMNETEAEALSFDSFPLGGTSILGYTTNK